MKLKQKQKQKQIYYYANKNNNKSKKRQYSPKQQNNNYYQSATKNQLRINLQIDSSNSNSINQKNNDHHNNINHNKQNIPCIITQSIFDGLSDDLQSQNHSSIMSSSKNNTSNGSNYHNQILNQQKKLEFMRKQSAISTQTQKKRKNQVRQKFNQYIQNRHSIQKQKQRENNYNSNTTTRNSVNLNSYANSPRNLQKKGGISNYYHHHHHNSMQSNSNAYNNSPNSKQFNSNNNTAIGMINSNTNGYEYGNGNGNGNGNVNYHNYSSSNHNLNNNINNNSIGNVNSLHSGSITRRKQKYLQQKQNYYDQQQDIHQQDGQLINQLDAIQYCQKFNRQIQQFILLFNKNPQNAINQYIKRGIILNNSADAIAQYLMRMQALNKNTLGQYFGQNNPKAIKVMHQYCKLLNFKDVQFDKALRCMLGKFRLPGQAQQIQRVIYQFTLVYYQANQNTFANLDQLFPFAYSIIMLATDAHNPKQQNKMTKQQFIKNTKGACPSIQPQYLSSMYDRITKERFQTQSNYIQTLYVRLRDLSLPNLTQALKFTKDLMKGDIFLKSCYNTNKFVQRKIYLSDDQKKILWVSDPPKGIIEEEPRSINIDDITSLTLGIGSQVMKRNKVPAQFDSMCFTINTTTRSLDLKARSNKDRAKWVNYIRAVLIQRRQLKRQKLQIQYNTNWNPQKIQQIWNTDIFPYWDKHWDYKHKKPKEKGYIARGIYALFCCCWKSRNVNVQNLQQGRGIYHASGFQIKSTLLQTLWKYGLPSASRKTLWMLIIGNNLALTPTMLQDLRKRRKQVLALQKCPFDKQVIQMAQTLLGMRNDLPPVRDLLLMSQVFYQVMPKNKNNNNSNLALNGLANLIHSHHFLSFYRGDKTQIQLRITLFQMFLDKNVKSVRSHFQGLRLQTRMYLVSWFLSVFSNCFSNQFLYRIWDNFLLQGQLYLFKVGITIIKYYQIELKMCTFGQGLKLLRFPKNTSSVLFFEILENQIDVKVSDYNEYIQKRKHAIIKTKVQSIPLQ